MGEASSGGLELISVSGARTVFGNPANDKPFLGAARSVDEFQKLNRIGEGTYGIVYRARDTRTGEIVALKKVRMENETDGLPLSSLREIAMLKGLRHRNIVRVTDVVVGSSLDSIFMGMEYCEQDMANLMDNVSTPYTTSEIKCLMQQLLEGIRYLHDHNGIHRDLKLSNLLLTKDGILKIADFGLARKIGKPYRPMTPKVVTLWYRAPELLFGEKVYTTAIDIWQLTDPRSRSAACIFGEFLLHRPLLPGTTEQQQARLIADLIGRPNTNVWPGFDRLPLARSMDLGKNSYNQTKLKFPEASRAAIELFNCMMTYNPSARLPAARALEHDWFRESPRACAPALLPTHPELRNRGPSSTQAKERIRHDDAERAANRRRLDEEGDAAYEFELGAPPWKRFRDD
ncbi:kinase-like domain-containing protein [Hyaloraphidium curvatum]|nr:kinase-like domain-containing protein [Hyaloraphidium curvatum]